MKIEEKTILWKPVSEYTGGRVLATNGLDILIGELNPEGDCVSEDCSGIHLCGITHFAKIDGFFPELKESEDEWIRKCIGDVVREHDWSHIFGVTKDDCLAWLEKQGEQKPFDKIQLGKKYKCVASPRYSTFMTGKIYKPEDKFLCSLMNFCSDCFEPIEDAEQKETLCDKCRKEQTSHSCQDITALGRCAVEHEQKLADKIEQKFHEGDWITNGDYTWKIVEVKPLDYILQSQDGNIVDDTISHVDEQFHSFAIEDAKDGDVLANQNGEMPFIFKECKNNHIYCYCGYTNRKDIFFDMFVDSEGEELHWLNLYHEQAYPATKEQRDLLFQKMYEAGYIFDFEKKKLKKIGFIDEYEGLTDFERTLADICISWIGKEIGWKEYIKDNADILLKIAIKKFNSVQDAPFEQKPTDEDMKEALRTEYEKGRADAIAEINNPAWSEEDEAKLKSACTLIRNTSLNGNEGVVDSTIDWLKSLKERVQPKHILHKHTIFDQII